MTRVLTILFLLGTVMSMALPCLATEGGKTAVPYRTLSLETFNCFVANWDAEKQPVLCADIRTRTDWATLFKAAAVMGTAKPFAPDAKLFEKEQILVVARVMPAPDHDQSEKIFTVETISGNDEELEFRYQYQPPDTVATYTVKLPLLVVVPKHAYRKIVFIENTTTVGTLDLVTGQWVIPAQKKK